MTGEVVPGGVITREGVYGRRSSIGGASEAASPSSLGPLGFGGSQPEQPRRPKAWEGGLRLRLRGCPVVGPVGMGGGGWGV